MKIVNIEELTNEELVRKLREVKCKLGQVNHWEKEIVDEAIKRILYLEQVTERIHTMVENLKKKGL